MQELIEYIESNEIVYNKHLILKLKELLEKEKEQIIASVRYGQNNHTENVYEEGELYYNEIYNSDTKFIKSSIPNKNIEIIKTNNL